ncbi:HPF/RaiA family ribosome-associated protein [Rhodobacteraceae bacterium 2376]|uniref:HPF/RaiA family ribosome-associated protein n=1 Tax=Rhabdonatronobacter sediminivivens TaxID=2743469 RepID=A0A7Z0KXT6_9RHOB|nr:HPF/RaiA family ribosome-associated protein [Rhabdonatronobacter sediminivivens]NYS24665.1 HPF/RaiA family ribosome-associated protein [Rhabdonatronobacter sediminivivens]
MQIQVNTDNTIQGRQDVVQMVESVVKSKLDAVSQSITRIEVHLQDQNAHKSGPDDKRCMVEARLQGRAPLSATHDADNITSAVSGAVDKLRNVLDTELGKLRQRR